MRLPDCRILWRQVEGAAGSPWFLGERFSALDIYLAVMTRWRPKRGWFESETPRLFAIARRAETNERMLYYYYGSKEKLFLTVLEHMYFRFKQAEEQVQIESSDPREAVIQLARFVWDFYYENPEFIRLLNSENLHEARHLKTSPHLGELVNPVIDVLRGVVERGQRSGIFHKDVDVSRLYLTISALGYYVLSNRYTISAVIGRDIASADEHEAFAQLHIKMLLAYLERPEG